MLVPLLEYFAHGFFLVYGIIRPWWSLSICGHDHMVHEYHHLNTKRQVRSANMSSKEHLYFPLFLYMSPIYGNPPRIRPENPHTPNPACLYSEVRHPTPSLSSNRAAKHFTPLFPLASWHMYASLHRRGKRQGPPRGPTPLAR